MLFFPPPPPPSSLKNFFFSLHTVARARITRLPQIQLCIRYLSDGRGNVGGHFVRRTTVQACATPGHAARVRQGDASGATRDLSARNVRECAGFFVYLFFFWGGGLSRDYETHQPYLFIASSSMYSYEFLLQCWRQNPAERPDAATFAAFFSGASDRAAQADVTPVRDIGTML